MPNSLLELKRRNLEKRLTSLHEEYEAANRQLNRSLSEVDQIHIQRQINDLEEEIQRVEVELLQIATSDTRCRIQEKPLQDIESEGKSQRLTDSNTPLQRPARAKHFTNRKAELAQLLADLQPGRVVTLCGPGGIGKSALAAEAIWTLAPSDAPPSVFPDGIIFHNFYNQPQAELALEGIVRAFGEEPRPTVHDAAQRILSRRKALLVLDGTEQADNLPGIMAVRGDCGVLITSRQRKDADIQRQDIGPLQTDEALTLLQAWGGARVEDESAARQICVIVGGLPLALRLIGRYLNEADENVADYLAWLKETPLQALDQGRRRFESVPLLLSRSISQMSEAAQQALTAVGLLALAPFEREVIAAALEMPTTQVGRWLGELVSYGLLLRRKQRYEVSHALIHTYARRRHTPKPEVTRHLVSYYETLALEQKKLGVVGYTRLDNERAHIMAIMAKCVEQKEWTAVWNLARTIDDYLDLQGHWTEWMTAIEAGLIATRQLEDRQGEGLFLGKLGIAYHDLGQVERAIGYYQQALIVSQKIGDRRGEGNMLGNLGLAYSDLGQTEQAIWYHEQALKISQEISDRRGEGADLGNLGNVYRALGQVEQAIDYYQQALGISREIGDRRNEGSWLGNLGLAYNDLGQVEQAIDYYQQALTISREIGDRHGESNRLGNLGNAYNTLGQVGQAIDYYQQALAISREIGDRRGEGNRLGNLGNAYHALRQVEQAIDYYQQALAISREIGDRRGEGNRLGNLGIAYSDLRQVERAIDYYQQAINISREIGDRRGEGIHLHNIGELYKNQTNTSLARQYLEQALDIFEKIKSPYAKESRRLLSELEGG